MDVRPARTGLRGKYGWPKNLARCTDPAPSTRPQEPRAPRSRLPEPAPKDRGQAGPEAGFLIPHLAGCSPELALSQMQRGSAGRCWGWAGQCVDARARFAGGGGGALGFRGRSDQGPVTVQQLSPPCPASQMGQACLKASIQSTFCHDPPQFLYFLHPR